MFKFWLLRAACLLALGCLSSVSARAQRAGSRLRLEVSGGFLNQQFAGIEGADFESFNRAIYNAALWVRVKPRFELGLQFGWVPMLTLSPVVFSDNTEGTYSFQLQQYQLLAGTNFKKLRVHALFGVERIPLKGTPELAQASSYPIHFGAQLGFDVYRKGRLAIPLTMAIVRHQERRLTFANFPDDPLVVNPGLGLRLSAGVSFDAF